MNLQECTPKDLAVQMAVLQNTLETLCQNQSEDNKDQRLFQEHIKNEVAVIKRHTIIIEEMRAVTCNIETELANIKVNLLALEKRQDTEISELRKNLDNVLQGHRTIDTRLEELEKVKSNIELLEKNLVSIKTRIEYDITNRKADTEAIAKEIEEMKMDARNSDTSQADKFSERIGCLEDKVKHNLEDIRKLVLNEKGTDRDNIQDSVAEELCDIKDQLSKLDDRNRRNNLLFHGLPQQGRQETWEDTEVIIRTFLEDHLQLSDIGIERAHRLNGREPRPIIVCFQSYKSREKILQSAYKLKGTDYQIKEDFSVATRGKRKTLWDFYQDNREEHDRCKLRYDKLIWRGVTYQCRFPTGGVVKGKVKGPRRDHKLGLGTGNMNVSVVTGEGESMQGKKPNEKRGDVPNAIPVVSGVDYVTEVGVSASSRFTGAISKDKGSTREREQNKKRHKELPISNKLRYDEEYPPLGVEHLEDSTQQGEGGTVDKMILETGITTRNKSKGKLQKNAQK